MDNDTAVKADNVSMKYRIQNEKTSSLKQFIIKKMKKELTYREFYALKNISFEIKKNEIFGIIGLNGAGKSTLVKAIAGIHKPTEGKITTNGLIAPLIELGAGFNDDLNGIENIYLHGMILGYQRKFINQKINEIIEFSELGEFINSPVNIYSSGMKARLAFSIATVVKPDILILDEVLSVGDFKFREKSEKKIRSLMRDDTTVIFISHSAEQVKMLCDRVLWLEKGAVRDIGETGEVLEKYKNA